MDPKANIEQQLQTARRIQRLWDRLDDTKTDAGMDGMLIATLAEHLAQLVIGLDEWRRKGGFDPYA